MGYYTKLVEGLVQDGFKPIQNLYDNPSVTDESKYVGLLKLTGTVIYAAVIFNTDNEKYYKPLYEQVSRFLQQHFAVSETNKLILTGIFISANPSDELKQYCTLNPDFSGSVGEIRWIADTTEEKRLILGHQPDKVQNIHKIADNAFGKAASATTLGAITAAANKTDKERLKSHNYYFTIALIVLNVIIFAAEELYGGSENTYVLMDLGAVERDAVLSGQWFRLFTHMFLHIGLLHIISNSLSLYIIGSRIERYYGKLNFGIIYFLSGIIAGLTSICFNTGVSAGASGAIFGLMGAMLSYTYLIRRHMDGFDLSLTGVFAVVGIFSGMVIENVDNYAHIGGLISGMIISFILIKIDKKRKSNG